LKNTVKLIEDQTALKTRISRALYERSRRESVFRNGTSDSAADSAVLFLLGSRITGKAGAPETCIVLNKRSIKVRQPGDLCFPGGRVAPHLDFWLSQLLRLPFSPIICRRDRHKWRQARPEDSHRLLLLATSLRESMEEMRLNPLGITFLGPLPPQRLAMFRRVIYPMVGWIGRQRRFFPNWEVDKIVSIPLRNLLKESNYACYRLRMGSKHRAEGKVQDFPCFVDCDGDEREPLWGATYRIVLDFLEIVYGFSPPDVQSLPVIHGTLSSNYLTGEG
jgi:hypothetical protein